MKIFLSGTEEFESALNHLKHRYEEETDEKIEASVKEILANIRNRGDQALIEYTKKYDGVDLSEEAFEIPSERLQEAWETLNSETRTSLQTAAKRINDFHSRQYPSSWEYTDDEGNILGQRILPLDRVGVYVPGGKAAYPSSVLMNVLPAKVAGVKEIIIVTPPARLRKNPVILAAAYLTGADRIFQIGGAQAVAALAYGTATIPSVDKIIGPGNTFVATAKRLVFGKVDIDMVAGPSEVLIVTDGHTDPCHLAADLLAQAEHDEAAVPMLISTSASFLEEVLQSLEKQLPQGPWQTIASKALQDNGKFFVVKDIEEAGELTNLIAPEHLELVIKKPEPFLEKIRHGGSIFIGPRSAVTFGDYIAGPNHVLPTMGTARFFSPLGVYDFIKRSSLIRISAQGLQSLGPEAIHLARMEGLHAHAHAVETRLKDG